MRTSGLNAVLAVTVVGGLMAGCATSDSGKSSEGGAGGGKNARNPVAGASEGPSAAPSALADGMGTKAADGEFPVPSATSRARRRSRPRRSG